MAEHYVERQRVLVQWVRRCPGEPRFHAARILEIRGEMRRRGYVQTDVRVEYEGDGKRFWHELKDVSPLEEDAEVASEVDYFIESERWQPLTWLDSMILRAALAACIRLVATTNR